MINTKALRKRRIHTGIRVLINIVTAIIVLIPLLYAVSIAFMPSGELFTMDMNLFPKNPTIENFKQAFTSVPLLRFIINYGSLYYTGADCYLLSGCLCLLLLRI